MPTGRATDEAGELAERLGQRVRRARKANGLTQSQTAERLGMAGEAYARIERGLSLPNCLTLVKICKALGVTPDTLLLPDPPTQGEAPAGTGEAYGLWSELAGLDDEARGLVGRLVRTLSRRPRRD